MGEIWRMIKKLHYENKSSATQVSMVIQAHSTTTNSLLKLGSEERILSNDLYCLVSSRALVVEMITYVHIVGNPCPLYSLSKAQIRYMKLTFGLLDPSNESKKNKINNNQGVEKQCCWCFYLYLDVLKWSLYREESVWILWRSCTPKVFHLMTWNTTFTL